MRIFDEPDVCTCIGCGCDDNHACLDEFTDQPCSWLRVDPEAALGVCSSCPDLVGAWDAGDRAFRVPVDSHLHSSTFQGRVKPWLRACFGETIALDVMERNHRFLEEALELVQSCGCTARDAHQLVDYVFSRPAGQKEQEAGGVMVTLAALCLAQHMNMHAAGDVELERVWERIETIRAKHAAKPQHSPLPA